ncbi:hypothetical protein [Halonatronomonas betaini]|nr:hypothetical protein [Halonatronomonas betaini]
MGFLNNILKLDNKEIKLKEDHREDFYQQHVQDCLKQGQNFL